jgi:hypothetical protein
LIHNPDFHHIIKRLRDRINSLAVFYCNDELNIDYRQLGEKAEEIKTQSQHVFWQDLDRFSSRRNLTQDMSGFMGWTTYEGDLEEFLSILLLGEWVHVGKASLWGNGWIQMLRL